MEFTNLDQTDCSCFEDLPLPTIIVNPKRKLFSLVIKSENSCPLKNFNEVNPPHLQKVSLMSTNNSNIIQLPD